MTRSWALRERCVFASHTTREADLEALFGDTTQKEPTACATEANRAA